MRVHRTIGAVVALAALVVAGAAATGGHTIRRGETLSEIARDHGVTIQALAAANGIPNPDRIRAGQRLTIPGQAGGSAAPARHVVRPGESLAGIAKKYGTTVAALAKANGITNPNRIYAGAALLLQANAPAGPAMQPIAATSTLHVVRSGETLGAIARKYGTTVGAIARANGISNPNRIREGEKLKITEGGGGWHCPVPGARFINDWGFARSGGRFHEGNDLMASRGAPVRAPVGGTVKQLKGSIGGLQFHLAGDDGVLYIGSHLDRFGDDGRVAAGSVIGYVGTSGNARGGAPHLHFEMHPGGRDAPAKNPFPSLEAACR
ncbi:MAG: LysM peptidoglycan-binding domain-containing M23 family metallopeptidase [Actinomycetota bacterium]